MVQGVHRRLWLTAFLVGAAALALYLATLADRPSGDSREFAEAVLRPSALDSLEAHQMLVHPLGWAWYHGWRALGWSGSAVRALQVVNAMAGALCVALVFWLAFGLTARRGLALAVAAGFALSYGTWALSTQAEFVTPPLAVQLLLLHRLLLAPAATLGRGATAVGLGLAAAAATLAYQTSVFLLPVGVACWLATTELPRSRRLLGAALFGVVGLAAATAGYLAVLCAHFGVCDRAALAAWELRAGMGSLYGVPSLGNVPHGAYALARTLGGYTGIGINDSSGDYLAAASWWRRAAFGGYYAALAVVMALPLVRGWRWRGPLWAGWPRATLGLVVWAVLFGAFAVYWVPGDVSFWLPVVAAWWLAVGLVVATGGRR